MSVEREWMALETPVAAQAARVAAAVICVRAGRAVRVGGAWVVVVAAVEAGIAGAQ